jgi:cytochrome c oxidase subunit 2
VGLQLPKRARRVGTWAAVSGSLLLLGACSQQDQDQISRLAMPEPASDRALYIDDLWKGAWLAAILVGILVWGLIGYAAWRYRRRSHDDVPVQTRYNLPIEILYTVAPIVMVLVFFYFTVDAQNNVLAKVSEEETGGAVHEIDVTGQQWSWTFNYLGEAAVDGEDVYTVGTTAEPPTLYLPEDEPVTINLHSPDVIHSFWVPAFLFKMDVIPGRENSFSFTPTEQGTYRGKCAELCGVYHSRMLFNVEVVSPEKYEDHLQELEDQGNVGTPRGGEEAGTQAGLESNETQGEGE